MIYLRMEGVWLCHIIISPRSLGTVNYIDFFIYVRADQNMTAVF